VASRACCVLDSSAGTRAQVNKIDDRPHNMKIAAGICACVGPIMFASYFIVDALIKKNK
jgi:hypothetical protein